MKPASNSRLTAAKAKRKTFEGKPCATCKATLRYTSSTQCVECSKERATAYGKRIRAMLKGE